jgi:hypothetical protein
MSVGDYRGPRGSLAGTNFHELWALHQAMKLLDGKTNLAAVTVEGFGQNLKTGDDPTDYDGVDCALIHGDSDVVKAERIEIVQLKYSGSNPQANWTLAKLTHRDGKKSNNSVLKRLGSAFKGLSQNASGKISVRLVSNQSVAKNVVRLFEDLATGKQVPASTKVEIRRATGLSNQQLLLFAQSLDFTSRTGSRFQLEEDLLLEISRWTDADANSLLELMLGTVRKLMYPENERRLLTRETMLLMIAGSPSADSLFPCPTDLVFPTRNVMRAAAKDIAADLISGNQRLCVHGGAGSGKTTVLQQVLHHLPTGSLVISFDCYGGGRYLDATQMRHKAGDAFIQLCNDLAVSMDLPLFLAKNDKTTAKSFLKRLVISADSLKRRTADALLVIVVDAADNSLTAARHFGDRSFVEDLISIRDLPHNVRLILSCRTTRMPELNLPADFKRRLLDGFTKAESIEFARLFVPHVSQEWLDDFHTLSGGVPRVESYALQTAAQSAEDPLALLQPSGKTLSGIFEGIFLEALRRFGLQSEFTAFCATLIVLPRPIPVLFCASLAGLPENTIRDLCWDLAPGLKLEGDGIAFADEDIEQFIRERAEEKTHEVSQNAATLLWNQRASNAYAATHVAAILFRSGRSSELLQMIETDPEPAILVDPLLRREVRLQRVKLGVKLANEQQDMSVVVRAIMSGAEAIRSDDAIASLLESNIDLAVAFAEESVTRRILTDGTKIALHGQLIAELMLKSALRAEGTLVRAYQRQYRAWLVLRDLAEVSEKDDFRRRRQERWSISVRDVGAIAEAAMLTAGAEEGVSQLFRWTPRSIRLRVAELIVPRLLIRGRNDLIENVLRDDRIFGIFKCWLLVPLARAGRRADMEAFGDVLADSRLPRIANPRKADFGHGREGTYKFFDTLLSACELWAAAYRDNDVLRTTLKRFAGQGWRKQSRLWAHDTELLFLMIRGYCLSCLIDGTIPTTGDFLGEAPKTELDDSERRRTEELTNTVTVLIGFCNKRAELILAEDSSEAAVSQLRDVARSVHAQDYRITPHGRFRLYELLMGSILDLAGFQNSALESLVKLVLSVKGEQVSDTGHEFLIALERASENVGTHAEILRWASAKAQSIGGLRCTASEKIQAFLGLARLTNPISSREAEAFFRLAHEATEDLDVDSRHQLRAISSLVKAAGPALDSGQKRKFACDFGTLTSNAALSIGEEEGFPWRETIDALSELDSAVALAAVSRWEDEGFASRSVTLEAAIPKLKFDGIGRAHAAVALNVLLESESLSELALNWGYGDHDLSGPVLDDLSLDALIFEFDGSAHKIAKRLEGESFSSSWLQRLRSTVEFSQGLKTDKTDDRFEEDRKDDASFVIASHAYTSASEIAEALVDNKKGDRWIRPEDVLSAIRKLVTPANRILHLDAVMLVAGAELSADVLVRHFEAARADWPTLATQEFIDNATKHLLKERLPELSGFLVWGERRTSIDRAIELNSNPATCLKPMIEGVAAGLDSLSAATLYEICGRMAPLFAPQDLSKALVPYLDRLLAQLDTNGISRFDGTDIPVSSTKALGRYLFSLLSDIEIATRWRAAHCLRRFVRYGDYTVLNATVGLWHRTVDRSFRLAEAPFYWQAARLWLMICLARLATEAPQSVVPFVDLMVASLKDQDFPHPALRSYAQDAVKALQSAGIIVLNSQQQEAVESVNTSTLPRTKRPWESTSSANGPKRERRFDFNPIDTIPYWFQPALSVFADVSLDELRSEAESWIIDRWRVDPKASSWKEEPRQKRLPERSWDLRSNDHGRHPAIEDYRTYLEWYSLQCSVGSLMASRPLATSRYDDSEEDEFEERIQWQKLTEPPYWLSDLVSPKPLESRFWTSPPEGEEWQTSIEDIDFIRELTRGNSPKDIVVSCWQEARSDNFEWSASVSSSLVEPDNSLALVRALQSADEPMDWKLPDAGDHDEDRFEIEEPGFRLESWLQSLDGEGRFDDTDPLCFDTDRTRTLPAGLKESRTVKPDRVVTWPAKDGVVYSYERWKNKRDTKEEYRGVAIKTDGHRLFAEASQVFEYLSRMDRDLIVEVRISRKRGGNRYQIRKEEEHLKLEGRFDAVILLRRDGSVHTADGCLGTWPIPC